MSDAQLRTLERTHGKASLPWLRCKIQHGQMSESMKHILCALGYMPMILAVGGCERPQRANSYNHRKKEWRQFHLFEEWIHQVAHLLLKKQWSRECLTVAGYTGAIQFFLIHEEKRNDLIKAVLNRL